MTATTNAKNVVHNTELMTMRASVLRTFLNAVIISVIIVLLRVYSKHKHINFRRRELIGAFITSSVSHLSGLLRRYSYEISVLNGENFPPSTDLSFNLV